MFLCGEDGWNDSICCVKGVSILVIVGIVWLLYSGRGGW